MSLPRDIERLLEGHAAGQLEDHERRVVEDVLAGRHERVSAAEAREALRFERGLAAALEIEPLPDDAADRVLDRVYRRPVTGRRGFRPDLASRAVAEALESGRIEQRPRGTRRYYFQRPDLLRAACFVGLLGLLLYVSLRDVRNQSRSSLRGGRPGGDAVTFETRSVGDVSFLAAVSEREEEVPRVEGDGRRRLYPGASIETADDQSAVLELPEGRGRILIHPQSRVRLRQVAGALVVVLEGGGLRTDIQPGPGVRIESGTGYGGVLRGRGEVVLASNSLGRGRAVMPTNLERSFIVSVGSRGGAVFRNGAAEIEIERGEFGVVGESAAVRLGRRAPLFSDVPVSEWGLGRVLDRPDEAVLEIAGQPISRAFVAREAMRVMGPDLVEMIVKSAVVEGELDRRGLAVDEATRSLALRFVLADEFLQVAPMRARAALDERAAQVAGLLTLASGGASLAAAEEHRRIGRTCETVWNRLAQDVRIEWPGDASSDLAFGIVHRGRRVEIGLVDAWQTLRRFLRVSEMRRIVDDLIERQVIGAWLESRGESWPEPSWSPSTMPTQRAAQEILVRMAGITMRQYLDRLSVLRVAMAYVPEPEEAEVDRFLMEQMPDHRRVVFEHYFYPFTEGDQGFVAPFGAVDRERARVLAEEAAATLAAGGYPTPLDGDLVREGLWRLRWDAGPRPWWDEVYGPDFRRGVLLLRENESSPPIEGAEGYHVVRVRRSLPHDDDPMERRRAARQLLKLDLARRRVEALLDEVSWTRPDPEALLR